MTDALAANHLAICPAVFRQAGTGALVPMISFTTTDGGLSFTVDAAHADQLISQIRQAAVAAVLSADQLGAGVAAAPGLFEAEIGGRA